jgi:hypothetical protein
MGRLNGGQSLGDRAFREADRQALPMTGTPWASRGATSSSMACMILGTPARTKTFPIWNPGATETGF